MTTIDAAAPPVAPTPATRRLGPYILPALLGANALAMLVAGPQWYAHTPGVADTGPYNGHFVADIGIAFAAATVSLLMGLLPLPHARLFALPAAVFLIGHAALHLAGLAHHVPTDVWTIATDVIGIYLPAWVAWRIVRPELATLVTSIGTPTAVAEGAIRAAERRLGVSMDYARTIARTSPATFGKLLRLSAMADHRRGAPAPFHLAGLAAALHDDCGECVQIHVNLARADGVPAEWLRAVLADRLDDLPPQLADAVRFGRAVAADDPAMEDHRVRLERHYGSGMVTELAFAIGLARFYPTLKRGLGVARACRLVKVEVADG
ncbi:MAG TPA: carboxymuconolactone decarboxylase family protein [Vineibacter sp.]|nr:carboxymuconolactone decarboxylase family protein [Vineibacter sp.]